MPTTPGEQLYERYKDALKRGHVASLRGRLDDALAAYAEAASIAPERSTPHTSAGTALLRRKRPGEALRHYEVSLRLNAQDEAALLGRAQALGALDRRPEAADAFDVLAELRAGSGKLSDAVDAARRGLEFAEGRERRRTLERLIERLRRSEPGEPGRLALERALRVLEGDAVPVMVGEAADVSAADDEPPAGEPPSEVQARVVDGAGPVPDVRGEPASGTGPAAHAEPEPGPEAEPGSGPEPAAAPGPAAVPEPVRQPEPTPVRRRVLSVLVRPLADVVDLEAMARDAEMTLDSGDPSAPARFLDLAAAYLRAGHENAAIDACYEALSIDPDDVGLHLALVQLFDDRGWTALATEKLDLLERLVGLGNDPAGLEWIRIVRTERG